MTEERSSIFIPGEVMSYFDYIDRVLYTPGFGYYAKKDQKRVGYTEETDFYTSMSVGDGMFGRLVLCAMDRILKEYKTTSFDEVCLIEVGAEPGHSITDLDAAKIFENRKTVRLGEAFVAKEDAFTILFANELLDAQPFQRFRYVDGMWKPLGVCVGMDGGLEEVILNEEVFDVEKGNFWKEYERVFGCNGLSLMNDLQMRIKERLLHVKVEEGYVLDYPSGAELLLQRLVSIKWKGMVVLFDYGFTWKRLSEECAEGTGRGYKEHKVVGDLLKHSTQMDITCHICWDFCREVLQQAGFTSIEMESQEKFLVQYAGEAIQKILEASSSVFSKERQEVMQLVHPGHMGQKFQVMWGVRQ